MNRTCRFLVLTLSALWLLGAAPSPPEAWNSGTYEANPANTDNVSQGDDHIRDLKQRVRERLNVEHHFGTIANGDATDDNGLHRVGSARCFVDTAAPVDLCDPGTACTDHDNAGGAGEAQLADQATNSSPAEDVGDGRCWIDTDGPDNVAGTPDDDAFYVYENNGWSLVSVAGGINPRSPNLLYNGDFEVNGDTDLTTPSGWVDIDSPTFVHDATGAVSEGSGLSVEVTDTGTGALDGIEQTITAESLKPSTTYWVTARVMPNAGDTCRLDVTNTGDTNTGPSDSTGVGGSFETLGLTFTTDATPNDTDVELLSTVAADVCEWDHVGVFEIGGSPARASRWVSETVSTATTDLKAAGDTAMITSPTFVAPHESCIAYATGQVSLALVPAGNTFLFGLELHAQKDGGTWTDIGGHTIKGTANNSTGPGTSSFTAVGYVTEGSASAIAMEAGSSYVFRYFYDSSGTDPSSLDMNCSVGSAGCYLTVDFDCRQ